ncbi:MAG TPA: redox-regulated ATPase YchF, partial [Thermoanaerobaculia bacterium]
MLRAGIVGLPNVGKSTLFNALTRTRKAEAANYPFCTIEPNVGVVVVPDARLAPLARIAQTTRIVPAAIEFVDIAGLVRGASKGEGLGNKFLQHIREVDAIVEVVRCFESKDIVHVSGQLDPVADMETVKTELVLADLETLARSREKLEKLARGGDKEAQASVAVSEKLARHLDGGRRALTLALSPEEQAAARKFFLLTSKPILFAANVAEESLATASSSPQVGAVRHYAETHIGTEAVVVSAEIESQLAELSEDEAREYMSHLGVAESGVGSLIGAAYHLLGLRTFLTAG